MNYWLTFLAWIPFAILSFIIFINLIAMDSGATISDKRGCFAALGVIITWLIFAKIVGFWKLIGWIENLFV